MLKCQWNMNECEQEAQWVCDVPIVGDSMCFCNKHKLESGGDNWYLLTPERAAQEEEVVQHRHKFIDAMNEAWSKKRDKQ